MSMSGANATTDMSPQHVAEYEQICEHYRQGYRTLIDSARLFMLLQAGLGTALGIFLAHSQLQSRIAVAGTSVNVPIFVISLIGLFSGLLALVITHRFLLYYRVGIERALQLEDLYGMRLMTIIHHEISLAKPFFTAVNSGRTLFFVIGLSWAFFLWSSLV